MQTSHNLESIVKAVPWSRGSGLDLVFKLILLFSVLPGHGKGQQCLYELSSKEMFKICSPQLLRLMGVLKMADYSSR